MDSTQPGNSQKRFIVQGRDLVAYKDIHSFASKREAKAYIRNLVRDWAESPREFRIVKAKRGRRRVV